MSDNIEPEQSLYILMLEHLPNYRRLIQEALDQQDREQLLHHIHQLHGAACYCPVPHLQAALKNIEVKLCQSSTFAEIKSLIIDLDQAITGLLPH